VSSIARRSSCQVFVEMITDVTLSSDQHFVRPLAVTVASLAAAHTSSRLTLHIINDGIGEDDKNRLEECAGRHSVRWVQPDVSRYEGVRTADKMPRASWFRISLGELLPDIERVLYLDADVIVERDLGELLDTQLHDNGLAAVREAFFGVFGVRGGPPFGELGVPAETPYFNAGVLVMDLERWRIERTGDAVLGVLRKHRLPMGDQDALNTVFAGRWHELHPRWNHQTAHLVAGRSHPRSVPNAKHLAEAIEDPGIVHFTGRIAKPWSDRSDHPYSERWFEVLDRTEYSGWRPSAPPGTTREGLERRAKDRFLTVRRDYRRWSQTVLGPHFGRLTKSVDSATWREQRVAHAVAEATSGRVVGGPFAGLRLWVPGDALDPVLTPAQFLGSYHLELHDWLESVIEGDPPVVVVFGSTEPVTSVGLACRLPGALLRVLTDDPTAVRVCQRLAQLNNVEDRILTTGCDDLTGTGSRDDCHPWLVGGTANVDRVLEPLVGRADGSEVVVEARDRQDPRFTPFVVNAFARSHETSLIRRSGRDPYGVPLLEEFDELDRWIAVSDNPDNLEHWIKLSPA
jgi:lipopolysaccharide biosynthesis glycosyltransferase